MTLGCRSGLRLSRYKCSKAERFLLLR